MNNRTNPARSRRIDCLPKKPSISQHLITRYALSIPQDAIFGTAHDRPPTTAVADRSAPLRITKAQPTIPQLRHPSTSTFHETQKKQIVKEQFLRLVEAERELAGIALHNPLEPDHEVENRLVPPSRKFERMSALPRAQDLQKTQVAKARNASFAPNLPAHPGLGLSSDIRDKTGEATRRASEHPKKSDSAVPATHGICVRLSDSGHGKHGEKGDRRKW